MSFPSDTGRLADYLRAHGHAEMTGGLGVAMVTAGPGVTNAMTGIANAYVAKAPVLVLSGTPPQLQENRGALQDMIHTDFVRPLTRYARTVRQPELVLQELDEAVSRAFGQGGEPGPVYLDFPVDTLRGEVPRALVLPEQLEGRPRDRMSKPQPKPSPVRSTVDALRQAVVCHQRGQLSQAETLYRYTLDADQDNFDALHLYGVLKHQRGEHADALGFIARALKSNGRSAAAHSHYGMVLAMLGRAGDALKSYERAIALKPDFAEALNNRGNALRTLKRLHDALTSFDRAVAVRPDYAEALNNRANCLVDLGRLEDALESYDRALAHRPKYVDALINRANTLRLLGRHARSPPRRGYSRPASEHAWYHCRQGACSIQPCSM